MAVAANPFHYGTPAQGAHFAGREEELAALTSRMRNGINVVVISPRRYGKTSLLLRAAQEVTSQGGAVVHVNVLRCRDEGALAARLATEAYHLPGGAWHRVKETIPDYLRRLRPMPTVSLEGDRAVFSFAPQLASADADAAIEAVYATLDELSRRHRAVLVLDEFQAIVDLGAHLPGLLKAMADDHPGVSLVLAGSKRHLMAQLVSAPEAALYGMAEHLSLGPLPKDVMATHLQERARVGRKAMTAEVANAIVDLAGPVPNDIQRLAYEAYDSAGERTIDVLAAERGLAAAVAHEAATFAELFERLSPGQRRVIATLADEEEVAPFSADFAARVGLANASSVRRAVDALESDELVVARDGRLTVADPFWAAWLRTPS